VAGLLIGIGMGGFMDGIVLHRIAQWHNTLLSHAEFVQKMQEWIEKGAACPACSTIILYLCSGVSIIGSRQLHETYPRRGPDSPVEGGPRERPC
jgi:hypothetical protein